MSYNVMFSDLLFDHTMFYHVRLPYVMLCYVTLCSTMLYQHYIIPFSWYIVLLCHIRLWKSFEFMIWYDMYFFDLVWWYLIWHDVTWSHMTLFDFILGCTVFFVALCFVMLCHVPFYDVIFDITCNVNLHCISVHDTILCHVMFWCAMFDVRIFFYIALYGLCTVLFISCRYIKKMDFTSRYVIYLTHWKTKDNIYIYMYKCIHMVLPPDKSPFSSLFCGQGVPYTCNYIYTYTYM